MVFGTRMQGIWANGGRRNEAAVYFFYVSSAMRTDQKHCGAGLKEAEKVRNNFNCKDEVCRYI